jgi:hypothetical protein
MTSIAPPGPPVHDYTPAPRSPAGRDSASFAELLDMTGDQNAKVFGFSSLGIFGRYGAVSVAPQAPALQKPDTSSPASFAAIVPALADSESGATNDTYISTTYVALTTDGTLPATNGPADLAPETPASDDTEETEPLALETPPQAETLVEGAVDASLGQDNANSGAVAQTPPQEEVLSPFHLVLSDSGATIAVSARCIEDPQVSSEELHTKLMAAAAEYGKDITDFTFNGRRVTQVSSSAPGE